MSNNTSLSFINARNNKFTSLDFTPLTKLRSLYIDGNDFTSVDVSKQTLMTTFWCNDNKITSLDLSANTALSTLVCYGNALSTLDVSKNVKLTKIDAHDNGLNSIDLTANTKVTSLNLSDNGRLVQVDTYTDNGGNTVYYIPTSDIEARVGDGFAKASVVADSWTGAQISTVNGVEALVFEADTATYNYTTGYTGTRDAVKTATFYLTYNKVISGVDEISSADDFVAYGAKGCINVASAGDVKVDVYDLRGVKVYAGSDSSISVPAGIYLVKAARRVAKVVVY